MRNHNRLETARRLMDTIKPKVIRLKPGEIKRLDRDLIVEKTPDEKLILYMSVKVEEIDQLIEKLREAEKVW